MPSAESAGGARQLRLRDWPFGAVGRRLLLETLLLHDQPEGGWTKTDLESRARVGPGGLDEVLAGAVELGLVARMGGRWRLGDPLPPIAGPLRVLVEAAEGLPDRQIPELPKRPYRRRSR